MMMEQMVRMIMMVAPMAMTVSLLRVMIFLSHSRWSYLKVIIDTADNPI